MRSLVAAAALFVALNASAEPVLTSVSPSSGPAAGGTAVTIKGTGFGTCVICSPPLPPAVYFAGVPAASVTLVDATTIVAVTPPMLSLTVDVTLFQFDGSSFLPQAFTFTGQTGYEPVLLPIFSPPVRGALGSEFVTEVTASNRGDAPVDYLGVDTACFLYSPVLGPLNLRTMEGGIGKSTAIPPDCNYDRAARILYVKAASANHTSFNVRVHDTSRNASSHGTEIPAVRRSDMTTGPIVLPGVPADDRFRAMLRVYTMSNRESQVAVTINGVTSYVTLQPGVDLFEPAYGTFTGFPRREELPAGQEKFNVAVSPVVPITSPPSFAEPFWAFITVTNNATQEITSITPDL